MTEMLIFKSVQLLHLAVNGAKMTNADSFVLYLSYDWPKNVGWPN